MRPAGTPCEVSLTAGETLRLTWAASTYSHNVFEVQSEDAFDRCLLGSATEVANIGAEIEQLRETVLGHMFTGFTTFLLGDGKS